MLQNFIKSFSGTGKIAEGDPGAQDDRGGTHGDGMSGVVQDIAGGAFGGIAVAAEYYFPPELIGGVAPRVAGQEREIAWNAAAEACDSERIHLIWSTTEDRVWYVASRASDLAAHPHTWCPFASLLPGMKASEPPPICYTYYSDEAATMMTVTKDLIQIHRGTSSVIRAKVERVARELGGAKIVDLSPDKIASLAPQAWHSVSLFEDRVRRMMTAAIVMTGVVIVTISFLVWMVASMALLAAKAEVSSAQERSAQKSQDLLTLVTRMRTSELREQLARFSDLNDGLVEVGGWLKIYDLKTGNKVMWKAIVPSSLTGDRIRELGGKTIETNEQGVLIGNDAAVAAMKEKRGRR
ncbi:MAG: hypothetical protein GC131_08055 [Alphaproteobacteria bacterium]|nr:hypothetical protein [Alphaproteobacteria bacterium]